MKRSSLVICLCVTVVLSGIACLPALAASVSYSGTIPASETNWNDIITLSQFDPSLGTLLSIDFYLGATISGEARIESEDSEPALVTTSLEALIGISYPGSSLALAANPKASTAETVDAFDGIIDWAGDSGRTYTGLTDTKTANFTTYSPTDFALFTGTGTVDLVALATGTSTASGAGNLYVVLNTLAGAEAGVTYNYAPVPEPTGLLLMVSGAGALLAFRRRCS